MINQYEAPEVVEIGRAQDVILGSMKPSFIVPESPSQFHRDHIVEDDE